MSLWYCPKCEKDIEVLAATGPGVTLSCRCIKFNITEKDIIENNVEIMPSMRKITGWKWITEKVK